jgi:leucyl-tRNA synthetase
MPVNLYVGGAEHAVLHLLYSRFWHKVLFDLGLVNTDEPFMRLVNQGMILGEGGVKMSKSLGNVINPDVIVGEYGADAMRVYEMFMGPLEVSKPWATRGIVGVKRFLDRIWRLSEFGLTDAEPPEDLVRLLHKTIKKVSEDTSRLEFNTAIAQMMIFINEAFKAEICYRSLWEPFVKLLAPYTPHLAEELWEKLGHKPSIAKQPWPQWREDLIKEEEVTVVIQVNGKVRDKLNVAIGLTEQQLKDTALAAEKVTKWLAGKQVKKVIVVPNKLVNIVIG